MGQPAARVTDMHTCPMVTPGTPPVPHVGGPIIPPCAPTVLTVKFPQARVSDQCVCVGPMDVIMKGSMGVLVSGMPAARMGDQTAHGGVIAVGAPTVLIGDTMSGGGGGVGMATADTGSGANAASEALASAAAYIAPWKQAFVYRNAAQAGLPFCERCS